MSARWRLRRAGAEDAPACALVAGATFLEGFACVLAGPDIVAHVAAKSGTSAFAGWATAADSVVTLAEVEPGHAPVGYTVLCPPDLPVAGMPGDVELKRIYALAPFHGTGLAAELMARAIADARAMGCTRMLLGVYGGNSRAQRFYAKTGFVVIGERRFLVGATWHDDLVFALQL